MRDNIALNYPDATPEPDTARHPNVIASELNWGDPLPPHIDVGALDIVLAADCVYFEVRSSATLTLPLSLPAGTHHQWSSPMTAHDASCTHTFG
jgi:hypothetical protein